MSTTTLFFIGGVINSKTNLLEPNCGKSLTQPYKSKEPQLTSSMTLKSEEAMLRVFCAEANTIPSIWKIRTFTHVALAPRFFSVTFLPFDLTSIQTLFVQKHRDKPPFEGFFAPYLSEDKQERYGCIQKATRSDEINNREELEMSIQGIGPEIYLDMKMLLSYFLEDTWSAMVGFTYLDGEGGKTTRFWYKKV